MEQPNFFFVLNETRYNTEDLRAIIAAHRGLSRRAIVVRVTYFTPGKKVHKFGGIETPVLAKQSHYRESHDFLWGHSYMEVSLVKPTPGNLQYCSLEDQMASLGNFPKAPRSIAPQLLWSLQSRLMEWDQHRHKGVCMPYPMKPWMGSGHVAQYEAYLNLPLRFGKKDPTQEQIEFRENVVARKASVAMSSRRVRETENLIKKLTTARERMKQDIIQQQKILGNREALLANAKEELKNLITGNL